MYNESLQKPFFIDVDIDTCYQDDIEKVLLEYKTQSKDEKNFVNNMICLYRKFEDLNRWLSHPMQFSMVKESKAIGLLFHTHFMGLVWGGGF